MSFTTRHIGPSDEQKDIILSTLSQQSIDDFIDHIVPPYIRTTEALDLPEPLSEYAFLNRLRQISSNNLCYKSYIGQGYYNTITPSVIQRNILENPGWYTAYTPYQAEISQGRLEALFNFQTAICSLTHMDISNASLLDEATAAAEAMMLLLSLSS